MSKVARTFAAAVVLSLACTPALGAQSRLELEISPFVGGALFLGDGPNRWALERADGDPVTLDDARYEDGWTAGMGVGLRFNDVLSVESQLAWVPTWLSGPEQRDGMDVYEFLYGVTGLVRLPVAGPVAPHWGVGVGAKTFDFAGSIRSRTQWATTFVAGLTIDVAEGESIRIQARDLLSPFEADPAGVRGGWENDLLITAGVSWRIPLGAKKPRASARGDGLFGG